MVVDSAGRLYLASLDRDDRDDRAQQQPRALACPSPQALPVSPDAAANAGLDIFDDDMRLGDGDEDQAPSAKRARRSPADAPRGHVGTVAGACCAAWGASEIYCGRGDEPVAQCRRGGAAGAEQLTVLCAGKDGGTGCLVPIAVESTADWPSLVQVEPVLLGALCGMELALLGCPILLQGGADGSLRASALRPGSAGQPKPAGLVQHSVAELDEPIVAVLPLRSAVAGVGAGGRLLVLRAHADGRRRAAQRQLPGPVDSACILLGDGDAAEAEAILLFTAGGSLFATGLLHDGGGAIGVGSTNFAALHRLPLGSAAAEVVPGGSDQVVVLLQDATQGEAGQEGRLLWLTRPE
ncbi:MAG: hypothetical protein VX747_03905, partial [Actinomycetota bacterium]|nr:hypothetical protein [Actinomycetota bacterium]